jgi:hypothetical protein
MEEMQRKLCLKILKKRDQKGDLEAGGSAILK